MWEGDWTLRQDLPVEQRYNVSARVSREKTDRMVRWLEARQRGVTLARSAVGQRATSQVYHAAEVRFPIHLILTLLSWTGEVGCRGGG